MYYSFLDEIRQLLELYKAHKAKTGEDFNIFSVMSMESDEVFTHSALLAELLNPKGTHGLGKAPLELFIAEFLGPDYQMNFETASSRKEVHIGFTNKERSEGGRVDIVIRDLEGNIILIENKIYAAEQTNQLARYRKYFPHAELFYLTLDGKESEQNTAIETEKIYRNLSYQEHIIPWISQCAKMAYDKPMLRETLHQYLFLLKKLTNQTTNTEMAEHISDIIKNNYEASLEIYRNFEPVTNALKENLFLDLTEMLQNRYNFLKVSASTHKSSVAVSIGGFYSDTMLYLWLKGRKLPVISIVGGSLEKLGAELTGFQASVSDGKVSSVWKLLPVLDEQKLFGDEIAKTKEEYFRLTAAAVDMLINKVTQK